MLTLSSWPGWRCRQLKEHHGHVISPIVGEHGVRGLVTTGVALTPEGSLLAQDFGHPSDLWQLPPALARSQPVSSHPWPPAPTLSPFLDVQGQSVLRKSHVTKLRV